MGTVCAVSNFEVDPNIATSRAVVEFGVIKETQITGSDALMGKGVYVNKLPPHQHSKEEVAFNNYDGSTTYRLLEKTDYAIELKVVNQKLEQLKSSSRSVLCYRGDIQLDSNTRIHRVDC